MKALKAGKVGAAVEGAVGNAAKVGTTLGKSVVGLVRLPLVLTLSLGGVVLSGLAFVVIRARRAVEEPDPVQESEEPQKAQAKKRKPAEADGRPGEEATAGSASARRGFFRRTARS